MACFWLGLLLKFAIAPLHGWSSRLSADGNLSTGTLCFLMMLIGFTASASKISIIWNTIDVGHLNQWMLVVGTISLFVTHLAAFKVTKWRMKFILFLFGQQGFFVLSFPSFRRLTSLGGHGNGISAVLLHLMTLGLACCCLMLCFLVIENSPKGPGQHDDCGSPN